MLKTLVLMVSASLAMAADDPWAKLREVKSGGDLRIIRKGSAQPLLAKMDELTDTHLVVVVKNEQTAIPREAIDRVDYRPSGSRVTKESKTTTSPPGTGGTPGVNAPKPGGSSTSSSTNVSIGSRPDFETVYRRPAGAPVKQ
jgi:hypothetical protein